MVLGAVRHAAGDNGWPAVFQNKIKKKQQSNIKINAKSEKKIIFVSHQKRRGRINKEGIPMIY